MRESFVFYKSFYEALEPMEAEQFKKMIAVITNYAYNGIEPELEGAEKSIFLLIRPQIDANNRRYENGKRGGPHGIKGGRPPDNPKETPPEPQENPTLTPNVNDTVTAKENVNVNETVAANVEKTAAATDPFYIQEIARSLDFIITPKQALAFTLNLDRSWLKGEHNFLVFAAEKIKASGKPQEDHVRLFIMSYSQDFYLQEYTEWRAKQEAEAAAQENRRQQVAAIAAEQERIEQARINKPGICAHCGEPIAPEGERGSCPSCGYDYFFNTESGQWEFNRPFNFASEFRKLSGKTGMSETVKLTG